MLRAGSCLVVLATELAFTAPVCTPVTERTPVEKALNFLGPAGATGTAVALLLTEGKVKVYVGLGSAVATALGTWYTWQTQVPPQPQSVCEPDKAINGNHIKIVGPEHEVRDWLSRNRTFSSSLIDQYGIEALARMPPISVSQAVKPSCDVQPDPSFNRLIGRVTDKNGRSLSGMVVQATGEVERSIERVTLTDRNGCYQFQFRKRSFDFGRLFYVSAYGNGYSRSSAEEHIAETSTELINIELEPTATDPFFYFFQGGLGARQFQKPLR